VTEASSATVKVSPVAARLIREAGKEEKLRGARGDIPLPAADFLTFLLFCCGSTDAELKGAAVKSIRALPVASIDDYLDSPDAHPRIIDLLARVRFTDPAMVAKIATTPGVSIETLRFLEGKGALADASEPPPETVAEPRDEGPEEGEDVPEEGSEETEEFRTKYQMAQAMGVSEKIKMALTGDKEWRSILFKDSNKLVNGAVIKNPRITDPEILFIAKSKIQNDEVVRLICSNKEWMKIYAVKKAMVENPKTPLPKALRFLMQLTEKDLASIAKSKNISSVISTNARKTLLNKKKK
jgi:hypothetical protein